MFFILGTSLIPLVLMKSRTAPVPTKTHYLIDKTAFSDLPYILLNLGLIFGFMGLYIVLYYIELYALGETRISKTLAKYLVVIINASSLAGRLIPGYYADKIGSINMQAVVALSSAILTYCLMAIKNSPGLVVYSILYGFSAGAFMGLPAAGVVSLSKDKSKIGTRLGMTLAFVGFGVLVSNPIAGAILDGPGGWVGLITWCGVLLSASSASMAASRVSKVGFGLKKAI